jgi:hypothetical protein
VGRPYAGDGAPMALYGFAHNRKSLASFLRCFVADGP